FLFQCCHRFVPSRNCSTFATKAKASIPCFLAVFTRGFLRQTRAIGERRTHSGECLLPSGRVSLNLFDKRQQEKGMPKHPFLTLRMVAVRGQRNVPSTQPRLI